jgi:hypothetical protein
MIHQILCCLYVRLLAFAAIMYNVRFTHMMMEGNINRISI